MKFDRLLWQCLMPGEHEFSEEGITVRLLPEGKETVLMFRTDSNAFRDGQPGVKACDLVFFYRGPAAPKPVLLFVELKGSDYEAAEAQLENAFKRVWTQIDPQCQGGESRVCAVAVVGRSVMMDVKARIKEAWQQRGLEFRYHFGALGKTVDLRPNLADSRRVKPPPAAPSGSPGPADVPPSPGVAP
ncbi:hypothetical protein BO221_20620 [Archangium sp. Cb G35]|uniref:hypothetical protein n=1 Tax=Archangium sp. Cb G35 TaxID=1920190 RepID=UPI000937B62A|nr:hypothetical protein [Archangium sp. Cb G35]OJT23270.1 hypothetical protein BO221_20620 [Archangium sp. Cb G35]